MARIIIAAALALVVAFSAVAVAQQGARASRWQPDQFGPIVPTDTMWSIAGYYGRQQGVSMFDMMDRIVAANPRAFRDNRPDFMLTGFYLDIPVVGEPVESAQAAVSEVSADTDADAAETTSDITAEPSEPVADTSVENEIAISVSEMQALRTQLSDSIDLIENLQGENSELQSRLAAVTRELNELRARADAEQQASTEMELIAQELSNEEVTSDTIAAEPETSNPAAEPSTEASVTEQAEPVPATTTANQQVEQETKTPPVVSKRKQETWIDWLLKPLQMAIVGGLLIILLGIIGFALYIRRVNREIEEGGSAPDTSAEGATEVEPEVEPTEHEEPANWQEESAEPDYAEVTDVDLDEYLRERGDEDENDASDASSATDNGDDDTDPMSQEVDELLAMDFPSEETEPASEVTEPAEDIAEFRVAEAEPAEQQDLDDDQRTRGELEDALDSFGGLRLDEDETGEKDAAERQDDEDYVSIESLMEEAETEASEEQEDPYDKEKLSEALGGEGSDSDEIDLSTEAMLDESKSPAAKLDLAQVYIDMGEIDDARELLESIKGCGDGEAERDAAELLEKLAEQGGR
ncbi:FimV/HubP family polar landmark protein [Pseudidiomarina homiensis]|uniref:FimV/HubP family polar landmark protein n=1 Tax=Pseudidiomarina homiensis TaxID=364198 RepID=UPI00215A841E|nr:FimV/HubP family polar landmark protein [Pseudidiomarina homiensis]